jgi:hypothetical protein
MVSTRTGALLILCHELFFTLEEEVHSRYPGARGREGWVKGKAAGRGRCEYKGAWFRTITRCLPKCKREFDGKLLGLMYALVYVRASRLGILEAATL